MVCALLIILVLLQSGKEGMGVIFGGGTSSVFGSAGAGGLLVKLTAFMGILFVITCLGYNIATSPKVAQKSTILDVRLEDIPASPSMGTDARPGVDMIADPDHKPGVDSAPALPRTQ
jgi:preprotein translocase subunit SecG